MTFLERQKTRFIYLFRSISMLLDPDPHFTDPDAGQQNQCGSMRIHNTANNTMKEDLRGSVEDPDAHHFDLVTWIRIRIK